MVLGGRRQQIRSDPNLLRVGGEVLLTAFFVIVNLFHPIAFDASRLVKYFYRVGCFGVPLVDDLVALMDGSTVRAVQVFLAFNSADRCPFSMELRVRILHDSVCFSV